MATASKTTEILMVCPECHETCGMLVNTDGMTVECSACNETIDPREAAECLKAAAEKWERFAKWLDSAESV